MFRKWIRFLPLVLVCISGLAFAAEVRTPKEPIVLFDGTSLDSFQSWLVDYHTEDPLRVFSVVDQIDGAPAIRISGEAFGGLLTKDSFRDYHLVVEFRWGLLTWGRRKDSARDSGILTHCQGAMGNTGKDFNGPWKRSVESQVIEGGVGDFILVGGYEQDGSFVVPTMSAKVTKDRDGENVYCPNCPVQKFEQGRINWLWRDPDWVGKTGFRGSGDVESPWGEWTRMEVICDDDSITNIVNGKVVNVGLQPSLTEGQIMIQSEGAEIYFRKVELLPLEQ